MINLDPWQIEAKEYKGDLVLVAGRQTGKSTLVAERDGDRVINNKNERVLIVAPTERQSQEIYFKILAYVTEKAGKMIKRGKDRPTKHKFMLTNGSSVTCLPVGQSGMGIRGLTITKLTIEEAEGIPPEIFAVLTPMLLTTGGNMDLLGTPQGQQGFFYEAYLNKHGHYKVLHVSTEKVINDRALSSTWTQAQRDAALRHLEREKDRMTKRQYQQEYLAEFIGELGRYFSDSIINEICTGKRPQVKSDNKKFLGVDVARLGGDESTFEIVEKLQNDKFLHTENIVKEGLLTWQTEEQIRELDKIYNFKKIGIDAGSGALGVGIYDNLTKENDSLARKIEKLNNRGRSVEHNNGNKNTLAKEDYYNNLKNLMERKKITLLDDINVKMSLRSVQYEYIEVKGKPSRLVIFGKYTHIVEGLIRAAQLANEEKSLNLYAYWR